MVLKKIGPYVVLMKPMIMLMSIFSAVVGILLASKEISVFNSLTSCLGIAITVGSACSFNMYFERDSDAKMDRTKNRPIPSQKVSPKEALIFSIFVGVLGLSILFFVNFLLGMLGLTSLLFYVGPYTLLKAKSYYSVFIGMLPGAAPVLMGWVATGREIDWPGLWLFLLILIWQIPHTLIIAHYLEKEYKSAGIKTFSELIGPTNTKKLAIISSAFLLLFTIFYPPFHNLHPLYYVFCITLGGAYVYMNTKAYEQQESPIISGRQIKNLSLVHLSSIFLGLVL